MARTDARPLQVALTGTRLAPCTDEELLARIKARFRLSDEQSTSLLKGRVVVKRGIDATAAKKLVEVLTQVGLQAVIEEAVPAESRAAAPRPAAAPTPMSPSRPASPLPVARAPVRAPAESRPSVLQQQPVSQKASSAPLDALRALANQRLPKPRTSLPYVAGLVVVTLLCVALPLVYAGVIGGVAFGWLWYLATLHQWVPRNIYVLMLLYGVPAITGAVVLMFLMRPLFLRRPRPPESLKIDPEKEADFVSGVHALCRAVGVSPPVEIWLTCDANASVHFRSGWWSFFTGHKVLTIGMSFAGGLTARQFVGVLAHEFGHFAQRLGMICSYTVNSINDWFEYCAHGRDPWSARLESWHEKAKEDDSWHMWIAFFSVHATKYATLGARMLMSTLFHLNLRLTQYMSRQMEFDADRYMAQLCGSDVVRPTARSARALSYAFHEVNSANIDAWQEHQLLRDLPDAVAAHAGGFDAKRLASIDEEIREQTTTRYWDSHPPDFARIENAEKLRAPGIYHEDGPATALFKDFAGWSQRATRLFYAHEGVEYRDEQLRSREEVLGHVRSRNQQREQLERFFNGQFQNWPLLRVGVPEGASLPTWQDCINLIRARSPEIARHWLTAFQAYERRALLHTAVRVGITSQQIGLPGPDRLPEHLGVELGNIAADRMDYSKPLSDGFTLYAMRIGHAIDSMTGAERDRAVSLRDTLAAIGALGGEASKVEELAGSMGLFSVAADNNKGKMPEGFDALETEFADAAYQLLTKADRIPQVVTADRSVGGYLRACCRNLPADGASLAPPARARACWPIPNALHYLYMLALGELVSLCEAAEKARGIRPIRLVA